jgi:hypothetical protein
MAAQPQFAPQLQFACRAAAGPNERDEFHY